LSGASDHWHRLLAVISMSIAAASLAACGSTSAVPTVAALPKPSLVFDTMQAIQNPGAASTTASAPAAIQFTEGTYPRQLVPGMGITVAYKKDASGNLCISYQLAVTNSTLHQRCATPNAGTLIAVQGVENSTDAKVYTIVVGQALSAQITAVSLEFADGGNTPADVQANGSFTALLSGQRQAIHAVPVDQYGNLVGSIFVFGS
jgi:hypothetical protein